MARRLVSAWVEKAVLVRGGLATVEGVSLAAHARTPVREHLRAYADHCEHAGQTAKHRKGKALHLSRYVEGEGITTLAGLSADSLTRHLSGLSVEGKSARVCNASRASCIAFARWCVRTGRLPANPLVNTPTHDESRDRRYVRRALTPDEVRRLLDEGEKRGRLLVYALGLFAGLRRGDLRQLAWRHVDLDAGTLTVEGGKARRSDTLPIHPLLLDALEAAHARTRPSPDDLVVEAFPDYSTVHADLRRAGIPRKDAAGRRVDLHACRTTLGTMMAHAGVPIHHAKRMMRHASVATTEAHYVRLSLDDTRAAVGVLELPRNSPRLDGESRRFEHPTDPKTPVFEARPTTLASPERHPPLLGGFLYP